MSNAIPHKTLALGIAALLVFGLAACDRNIIVDRGDATAAGADPRLPVEWFAARPQVLRAELDAARGRVWTLEADGVEVYDARRGDKLRSVRLPGWTWVGWPDACSPGLALGASGEAVITSNVLPVLWRVDGESFEVTRHDLALEDPAGKDIGFSGLTYSAARNAFFAVGGLEGSLWSVDPALSRARPIALSASLPKGCGVFLIPGSGRAGADALCVITESGDWTVTLTPDSRAGHASPTYCSNTIRRTTGSPSDPSERGSP